MARVETETTVSYAAKRRDQALRRDAIAEDIAASERELQGLLKRSDDVELDAIVNGADPTRDLRSIAADVAKIEEHLTTRRAELAKAERIVAAMAARAAELEAAEQLELQRKYEPAVDEAQAKVVLDIARLAHDLNGEANALTHYASLGGKGVAQVSPEAVRFLEALASNTVDHPAFGKNGKVVKRIGNGLGVTVSDIR